MRLLVVWFDLHNNYRYYDQLFILSINHFFDR